MKRDFHVLWVFETAEWNGPREISSAAFEKDGHGIVVLVHLPEDKMVAPERWAVVRFDGISRSWKDWEYFGSDLLSFQAACARYIARASEFIKKYPSWAE